MKVKRENFKDIILKNYRKRPDLRCIEYLESLREKKYEENELKFVKEKLNNFVRNFKIKFESSKVSRRVDLFVKIYGEWLCIEEDFTIPESHQPGKKGAPGKSFENLSERGRFNVVQQQLQSNSRSSSVLFMQVAEACARKERRFEVAQHVKKIRLSVENNTDLKALKADPEKSLSFILKNNFSVNQYKGIKTFGSDHGSDLFPSYKSVHEAKNDCRPEGIIYMELKCEVTMQRLLDHTSKRIMKIIEKDLITEMKEKNIFISKFKMISNLGFDGTSHQSNYNQKFESPNVPVTLDSNLFVTTLTPLFMKSSDLNIGWINESPHSSFSVRPKTIEFIKVSLIKKSF